MPTLTVNVTERLTEGVLGQGMKERLQKFNLANKAALKKGATKATETTRRSFKYRRDIAPPRPGRSTSGGRMTSHLKWGVNNGQVIFAARSADQAVPQWIIQEIGTGEHASLSQGPDLPARQVSVKSQLGRPISAGLVFATGGKYSHPGASSHEQLYRASEVTGIPLGIRGGTGPQRRDPRLRITKEIKGQHFVKKGGIAGFREYETSLLAAARQAFGKRTP